MAIKDYAPSVKTVAAFVVGAAVAAGISYGVRADTAFVPSKETCSTYFEYKKGERFFCIIRGDTPLLENEGVIIELVPKKEK